MAFFTDLEKFADSIACVTEDAEISYQELCARAGNVSSFIPRRSLVFSLCTNSFPSVYGYVGFLQHDIVPVLLNAEMDEALLQNLLQAYTPGYIWSPVNRTPMDTWEQVYAADEYALYRTKYDAQELLYDELGLLLTTSGSTGSPKLVRQSYKNIASNTEAIIEYLSIQSSDRPITTLPMSYTYGLSIINSHLQKGAKLLLTGKSMMEKGFWKLFREKKATTFGGVPYTYKMLKRLRFFSRDLSSVRYLTQAGGKLSYELTKETVEQCEANNIDFIVMYGQTEATARMSYLPSEYALQKCGSMGKPIPGGEFWLQDDYNDRITQPEKVGELVYKGDNVTLGYALCCADLQKGDERGGVLFTGDLAKFDEEGFFSIVGRKKRFIKLFGNRINLDETELILTDSGYICACAGEDDLMRIYTEHADKADEIQKFLSLKMKINASAFSVIYVEEIPKNEAGKTLYSALEK